MPVKIWIRLGFLVALVAAGFALLLWTPVGDYFTEERMIGLLAELRAAWWTPLLLIASYVVVTPLGMPVTPSVVAGGMVYGPFFGTIYNALGLIIAAMVAFYVARSLGREFVVRIAGPRLRRAERVFEKQGFWPLVQVRFLPIPFAVVSYASAMAGVKAPRFLVTTALGVTPATVVHTYFMPAIIRNPGWMTGFFYIAALVLLNILAGWQGIRERWRRRRRYRELLEERQRRAERRPEPTPP